MSVADRTLLAWLVENGARLREVRRDWLRHEPGGTQRWFQGPDGCDLFLWYRDPGGLTQIQLTFQRRVIEWSDGEGARTGRLQSFDPRTPLRDQARLVFDRDLDEATLAQARALLERAPVDDVTLALVRTRLGLKS